MIRRYLVFGFIISVIVVSLAFMTTLWVRQNVGSIRRGPLNLLTRSLSFVPPQNRKEVLSKFYSGEANADHFYLIEQNGTVTFPENDGEIYDVSQIHEAEDSPGLYTLKVDHDNFLLSRLNGEPAQYLLLKSSGISSVYFRRSFVMNFSILSGATFLGVFATIFYIFYSLRMRSKILQEVITSLKHGNLKARFPVSKADELGQTMLRFNQMAEEIEQLVEHLRRAENARKSLLRELAHDLRTPIASLKSLLETLEEKKNQISDVKKQELLRLASRETQYFEHLVEDLLFLGQVGEPQYRTSIETVSLVDLLKEEIESVSDRYPQIEVQLKADTRFFTQGDSKLLKRLFRNALENAFSYANHKVEVLIRSSPKTPQLVMVAVSDDGPGFSESALQSFGQKKFSRSFADAEKKNRISIGLGSVIMKSIAESHRGQIYIKNHVKEITQLDGACVMIQLPLSTIEG